MSNRFYPNQQFPPLPPVASQAPPYVPVSAAPPVALPPPPDGTKPRISITFWEDENTLCYQVDARGIPVSRRQDTNFINGTKLLNVSHMTRGRRDGILKGEQIRYVVKIGAMNLKGVWIPFERAVELAKSENIYEELEPLFIPDIKSYYDHYYSKLDERQNPGAKAAVLADQRRQQQLQEQYWNYTKQLPQQPKLPQAPPPPQQQQQYKPNQYFPSYGYYQPPPPPQQLPHLYNKQQFGYQPYFPLAQPISPPQPSQQQPSSQQGPDLHES